MHNKDGENLEQETGHPLLHASLGGGANLSTDIRAGYSLNFSKACSVRLHHMSSLMHE